MRKAIDWSAVKARLARVQTDVEKAQSHNPQRLAAVYAARAERLAQRRLKPDAETAGIQVLTFVLGGSNYALEHAEIAEVLPLGEFTPVPAAPPELFGLINLRGEILPVVDLARVLELAPNAPPESGATAGYIIVLRRLELGLKVDHVNQIRRFSAAEIEPEMAITQERSGRYLKGIARDTTLILCVDSVLAHSVFETV